MSSNLYEAVAFDSPAQISDGQGGYEDGWTEQFTCRAAFTYLRGGEAVMASRLEGKQPVVMRVRRSSETEAITTDWRARDTRRSEVYNVRSVIPTEDRRWLDITAESGVAV